jgi:hypothetical protein
MPTFRQSALALIVLCSLPAGATDYFVDYGGTLPAPILGRLNDDVFLGDVDPIFHRPLGCGGELSNGDHRYDTITFANTTNSQLALSLNIDTGFCEDLAYDSFVYGYSPAFSPNDPNANCITYNDDFAGYCSRTSTSVAPSEVFVFVVTSFYGGYVWPWTATFSEQSIYSDDFECSSNNDFHCESP